MQSFIYKRLFSYSMSRRFSLHSLYYARLNRTSDNLHHRIYKYFEEEIMKTNKKTERNNDSIRPKMLISSSNPHFLQSIGEKIETEQSQEEGSAWQSRMKRIIPILDNIQFLKNVKGPMEMKMQLEIIDRGISEVLEDLSVEEILALLNKMSKVAPQKILSLKTYLKSLARLRSLLSAESVDATKIVNFLFLVSQRKREGQRDVRFGLKYLPNMSELSLVDKSIVSLATFKVGVKLDKESIRIIEDVVEAEIDLLLSNPGLFSSLLKALRFAGPSKEFSLNFLSNKLLETKKRCGVKLAVSILALYAETLSRDVNAVKQLVWDSMCDIKYSVITKADPKTIPNFPVRTKDADRLLWATSRLNHKMSKDQLETMERFLEKNFRDLENNLKILVGMLLSLWMLRSPRCREKVELCLQQRTFEPLLNASEKDQRKLRLLLECVRIEAPSVKIPEIFSSRKPKTAPMKNCVIVETIAKLLKCSAPHLGLEEMKINCPIKWIRVYGITTRHNTVGLIHIDLLNDLTCLKDTRKPHGLMCLKLRLVKTLGYFSILVKNDGVIKIEPIVAMIEECINSKIKKLGE